MWGFHLATIPLQTFLCASESASRWREVTQWRTRWLPNYIQWPSSKPLVDIKGVGTEEARLAYPASGTRLEAYPVLLE